MTDLQPYRYSSYDDYCTYDPDDMLGGVAESAAALVRGAVTGAGLWAYGGYEWAQAAARLHAAAATAETDDTRDTLYAAATVIRAQLHDHCDCSSIAWEEYLYATSALIGSLAGKTLACYVDEGPEPSWIVEHDEFSTTDFLARHAGRSWETLTLTHVPAGHRDQSGRLSEREHVDVIRAQIDSAGPIEMIALDVDRARLVEHWNGLAAYDGDGADLDARRVADLDEVTVRMLNAFVTSQLRVGDGTSGWPIGSRLGSLRDSVLLDVLAGAGLLDADPNTKRAATLVAESGSLTRLPDLLDVLAAAHH